MPSHDTFSHLFRLLDPTAFAACFGRFLEGLGAAGAGGTAIDGKTLRRSFDAAARGNPSAGPIRGKAISSTSCATLRPVSGRRARSAITISRPQKWTRVPPVLDGRTIV